MVNSNETNPVRSENTDSSQMEVEQLKQYIREYSASVTAKVNTIEEQLDLMETENARLIGVKDMFSVERDACIGLILELAIANGLTAGNAPGNRVAVDLPSGQVSWEFAEAEAHLFSRLPAYTGEIEELSIEEKYHRVMNSGIGPAANA